MLPANSRVAEASTGCLTELHAMQSSCLPVVYKMLTAEDKGAQQAAVKMLTCLCQVDAEWQQQEQLAIANFGNGAILLSLVERVRSACQQRKLSGTRVSELSSVLNLVSLTSSGECCMTENERKENITPFGINLTRSQVLYWAAQSGECCVQMLNQGVVST